MNGKITLQHTLKQQLNVHLVQQMHLLQLSSMDLTNFVAQAVEANPVLDFPWTEEEARSYRPAYQGDTDENEDMPDPVENAKKQDYTLQQYLEVQLGCQKLDETQRRLTRYIAGTLDARGYWTKNSLDTAKAFGVTEDQVWQALEKIQSLEPAGVGAQNFQECLLLQLCQQDGDTCLAKRIVKEGLEQLAGNQIPALASQFHTTKQKILAARDQILKLNPKPGAGFASGSPVLYQREDAFVEATEKGLKLTVYDNWGGKFTLNQEYVQLSKTTTNNQVKDYLKEQLGKARQLQQLLAERHHTLVLVFHALVTHQEPFFREGPGHRQPLKLADLAEETGMSISTISRALSHKYIACKWGSFPADSFLVNAGTTETQQVITDEKFEHLIRSIIDAEDKKHPLSDQGICQKLEEQGIKAARRTVNKYRTKMGIGDKSARKKWE